MKHLITDKEMMAYLEGRLSRKEIIDLKRRLKENGELPMLYQLKLSWEEGTTRLDEIIDNYTSRRKHTAGQDTKPHKLRIVGDSMANNEDDYIIACCAMPSGFLNQIAARVSPEDLDDMCMTDSQSDYSETLPDKSLEELMEEEVQRAMSKHKKQ